jgi:hypothetical protein
MQFKKNIKDAWEEGGLERILLISNMIALITGIISLIISTILILNP